MSVAQLKLETGKMLTVTLPIKVEDITYRVHFQFELKTARPSEAFFELDGHIEVPANPPHWEAYTQDLWIGEAAKAIEQTLEET